LTTLNARAAISRRDEIELTGNSSSGTAQRNIKIRIETTKEAVRDKEQAVGAPGV